MKREPTPAETQKAARMFFIDSENGIERLTEGCMNLNANDTIVVFHRDNIKASVLTNLEFSPAQVDFIECVDRGVKNSMDVQIIAELALRLGSHAFDEGYVISRDKGFRPAIHYLQLTPQASSCKLSFAESIDHGLFQSVTNAFSNAATFDSRVDIERAFSLVVGPQNASTLVERLDKVLTNERSLSPSLENTAPEQNADSADDIFEDQCADRIEIPLYEPDTYLAEDTCPEQETVFLEHFNCDQPAETNEDPLEAMAALFDRKSNDQEDSDEKLTNLKGIDRSLSRKLKEVGISTPSKLRTLGSVRAWQRIREIDRSFPMKWLYVFEVAIHGGSLSDIETERKRQLKRQAKGKSV